MGDDQGGPTLHDLVGGLFDLGFDLRVHRTRCFIQDQNPRIEGQGPCEGEELSLPHRQGGSPFSQGLLIAFGQDVDDPKVKSSIAAQVMPLIEDVVDSVERETYRQHLARRLRVDERALLNWRPRSQPRRRTRRSEAPLQVDLHESREKDAPIERFCLGLLIQNPELLYRIDRQLQSLQMERLSELDFSSTVNRIIFKAIKRALAQDDEEPAQFWRGVLDDSLHDIADGMSLDISQLQEFVGMELEQPKVTDEITARFLQLRKRSMEENLRKIHFLVKLA